MKTCLLCNHQENGGRKNEPDVDFICSGCIAFLVKTPVANLIAQYQTALKEQRYGVAYALHTFVPRKVRRTFKYKPNTSSVS